MRVPYSPRVLQPKHGSLATIGKISIQPGGVNAIAGSATAWLDARAADELRCAPPWLRSRRRSTARVRLTEESWTPQTAFDDALVSRLASLLDDVPVMSTGAGHDAGILANAGVPAVMIFVRNPTGVSHSPAEWAEPEDCLAGVTLWRLCWLTSPERSSELVLGAYAWLPDGCRAGVAFEVEDGASRRCGSAWNQAPVSKSCAA